MSSHESPIYIENEWSISENRFDPVQIVTTGSNFMTGNGYLGYRGTFPEWEADEYVGCIVSDTYDNADGKWKELCNVPNGLYTALQFEEASVHPTRSPEEVSDYRLSLNYRYVRTSGGYTWKTQETGLQQGTELHVSFESFASYSSLHLLAQRGRIAARSGGALTLSTAVDGQVWSLNGEHFRECSAFNEGDTIGLNCTTTEKGVEIVVAQGVRIYGVTPQEKTGRKTDSQTQEKRRNLRQLQFELQAGDELVIEQMMTVFSGNDTEAPYTAAVELAREATENGYEREAGQSARVWDALWNRYFIHIDSSDNTQALLNYNLYHNIIAAPAHSDKLPIGARGLSCQAYQGAAFWDQEIFNLPMFLFTETETAKNILKYRYHTIDGARKKAEKLGYAGAFYAWISGKSGEELCPSFFFKDVLTGRKIRNHFNDWQIHVSPDISYTIWKYYLATKDIDFVVDYGSEILFEVARFLHSRVHYNQYKDKYEIIRLLGPDEYHENVDNNAFTNYQTQFALKKALYFYYKMENEYPEKLLDLKNKIDLTESEVTAWQQISEKIYLPQPDENNLIEQFDGYFDLEDTNAEVLKERLIDKEEYW